MESNNDYYNKVDILCFGYIGILKIKLNILSNRYYFDFINDLLRIRSAVVLSVRGSKS